MRCFPKAVVFSGLLASCLPPVSTLPPNLHYVGSGLWRSGQPTTPTQWRAVRSLGVVVVVKLNFDSEGSDELAKAYGMTVVSLPVQPAGDVNPVEALGNVFHPVDESRLELVDALLAQASPTHRMLVHCTHGQDRTGLAVARYRVLGERWTPRRAWDEAMVHGFHPELLQLTRSWFDFAESH